ncbi:Protein of unknown function [Solimonas aquatica]|uniref:DUF2721 domain-containing protein n=1 Tax=Solimonas aquatica TaxID=489703 RepID=A0A1H9ALJ3_9GAMM|nr:DUF2721 domain-containing protein [Solimonas aquatica]SEP77391.1 Protein of unknown function [Solimonas aquatica]
MDNDTQLAIIAHTIQVAVAPVFLLGGVSSMLGVLTSRLARIVDRARALEIEGQGASPELQYLVSQGLQRLSRRARLTSKAIAFCIGCALLISSVIVVLFVGAFSRWNMAVPTAALFVLAVLSLICGLFCFLREVQLATRYLRIGEVEPERRLPVNEPPA